MIRIVTFIAILAPCLALAGDVTLGWDHSPSEGVTGYNIYYGQSSGDYDAHDTTGYVTLHTVTDLQPGAWYFTATAIDIEGNESGYSNEVHTIVQSPDGSPQILSSACSLQWFGVLLQITTDVDTSAIVRYSPIEGSPQWVTAIVTEGSRKKLHLAKLEINAGGEERYYRYEWNVTDADGRTTTAAGTFMVR